MTTHIGLLPSVYFCQNCNCNVEVEMYEDEARRKYNQSGWIMCYCKGTYVGDFNDYPDSWVAMPAPRLTKRAADVCHSCGENYVIDAAFCHKCGTRR